MELEHEAEPEYTPLEGQIPDAYISVLHPEDPHSLGPMNHECSHCGALHFLDEAVNPRARVLVFEKCCKKGAAILEPVKSSPPFLRCLFTGQDPRARLFRKHIREYNAALSFTSLKYNKDERLNNRGGIQCFQIHGEIFHRQGPLIAGSQETPAFAQLFFYDPEYATEIRKDRHPQLDRNILLQLHTELIDYNPFIDIYKTARERIANDNPDDPFERIILNPQMRLVVEKGADRRRENLPTRSEIAVILPDEMEAGCRELVLAVRNPGSRPHLEKIHATHASYMPLHYVLFFPQGDYGWNWDLQLHDSDGSRLSSRFPQQAFYRSRLSIRKYESSMVFYGERLFQQYIVDAFASCESPRLNWIRNHQRDIRADVYNGIQDTLYREDVELGDTGRRSILPPTHTGSPRFMQRIYQDSMALVRHFGKPNLFITFTANPHWPEIEDNIFTGQQPYDRPDIIARVFHLKVGEIVRDLKKGIFGPYAGHVNTIEYQKRGLPHMHLLLFLRPGYQINTPRMVDEIVCAEIPDPIWDPTGVITSIVTGQLTHGPCGDDHPFAACMESRNNGPKKCQKGFPKPFCSSTNMGGDGYPEYRRRNDGRRFTDRNGNVFTNAHIVPYNPYLCQKFTSHINVEICANVGAIKYIHKYIYKGTDRSTISVQDDKDEIAQYIRGRYIGPAEAFWRIFEFHTHQGYPPVQHLDIHLEGQQCCRYDPNLPREAIEEKISCKVTTLIAFFEYNRLNEDGRETLYQDFPWNHTFETPSGQKAFWKRRTINLHSIGRIWHCSPTAGERYYLRLLLTAVYGPTSFTDLYDFEGITYPTYHAACISRGLAENDQEWFQCFDEAKEFTSGHGLRMLFVTGLCFSMIADPPAIWERFKVHFCDDLQHRLENPGLAFPLVLEAPHLDYGLFLLGEGLAERRMTLTDHRLPSNTFDWSRLHVNLNPQYNPVDQSVQADDMISRLNSDQLACFHTIVAAIDTDPQTAHFYLQGPGGTGKTFLYKTLCFYFRGLGKSVLCVASTGIAALLLPGGRTSHTAFGIPIDLNEYTVSAVTKDSKTGQMLKNVDLIIWDEVPMQHKFCFDVVNRLFADLRSVDEDEFPFGGVPAIFGGDFAQILPVVPGGTRGDIVNACFQQSQIWPRLKMLWLRINMRVRNSPESEDFVKWISSLPYNKKLYGRTPIPPYISRCTTIESLMNTIYPSEFLQDALHNFELFRDRAILAPTNATVTDLNNEILKRFPGETKVYWGVDTVESEAPAEGVEQIPVEFLQTVQLSSLPPSVLSLKVGAPVMLLRNLLPEEGLCNGTRMVITKLMPHCLEVRLLGGDFHGRHHTIPRIKLSSNANDLPYIISRKQFPVRLAFTMTINKSQGQSFNCVGVDLRTPVFSHGQFYVAVSRVCSPSGLHILLELENSTRTENTVWPEVLTEIRGDTELEEQ